MEIATLVRVSNLHIKIHYHVYVGVLRQPNARECLQTDNLLLNFQNRV